MRFTSLSDWLSWQEGLHPNAIDLGLERLTSTLERLRWQRPSFPVVTVGGTNGKGSCVAMLDSILRAAGYRVGVFTSPHLRRYNERIRIVGQEVSDASLMAAFERIDAARANDTLTFFEFNTLAALLVFESAGVDVAVLEVGMGGRLDAVNVIDADVALIASVALDHCEWLGHDLETIGNEKAGILRASRRAIFGSREMPVSIATTARERGASLRRLGVDFDFAVGESQHPSRHWSWWSREARLEQLPYPALRGAMQFANAAAVLAVIEALALRLPVDRAAIEEGLEAVCLAGRFQQITLVDALGTTHWILDVAHNPAAAANLARELAATAGTGRTIAVCGILGDKDIESIAASLQAHIDLWVVSGLGSARALPAGTLAARLQACGANIAGVAASVTEACSTARHLARESDRIVVFGSFLTVGPALDALEARGACGNSSTR